MTLVRSGIETELVLGADASIYRVDAPPRLAGRALSELARGGEIVPVAVERGSRILLAPPDVTLERGDVLHLASTHRDLVTELVRP
jgi:Trk K+ transport system NAD-binding subunit